MTDDRILTGTRKSEDVDAALRPKTLDEFVGQRGARWRWLTVSLARVRRSMR